MELKFIHLAGPLLAIAAFYSLGRNLVRKEKGRSINPLPALLLLVMAVAFHFVAGEGTLLDRVCLLLLDFGIAMILDAGYLAANKTSSQVFWVPGLLALIAAAILYVAASAVGLTTVGPLGYKAPQSELLLELGPDDQIEEVVPLLEQFDATWEDAFPTVDLSEDEDLAQYFLVRVPESDLENLLSALRKDKENVDHAEANVVMALLPQVAADPFPSSANGQYLCNDPRIGQQWWLSPEVANPLHEFLSSHPPQRKAKVAILDTGVDNLHEDLKGIWFKSPGAGDQHGHGTHCAGLAGAITDNGTGIASLNWKGQFLEILAFRALGEGGSGSAETVAQAIIDAADAGVDVINLSLGSRSGIHSKVQQDAVEYALKKGVIVVAAAGNNQGLDAREISPANVPGVITVAAVGPEGNRAPFSNNNGKLKMPIAAPGVNIFSAVPNGKYDNMNGTSMAAPIVAGIVGILKAYQPQLDARAAWQILHDSGQSRPDMQETGRVVQPLAAIMAVQ